MATKTAPAKPAKPIVHDQSDVVLDIPLGMLHPAEDNPRGADLGDLTGLAESIGSTHILEPLIVVDRAGGGYMIVAGHRRHAAAKIAGLGHAPCIVRTFAEVERLEAMAIENMQREDLSPLEAARSFQLLVDAGRTQRDIADRCGVSQAVVSKRLSLLKLPEPIKELVAAGKVGLHDAETMAQAKPEALAAVGTPEFIKHNHGALRPYDVTRAQEQLDDERARAKALKSGLPEWNQQRDGHEYDYDVDRDVATHFKVGRGKTVWIKVRKTKRGAGGPTPAQKAAERAVAERHAERRRFAGLHLAKLNDCALRVSLVANYHAMLRTDGDDARIVLDWLGTRNRLAKDTKGLAVTAWKALRTPTTITTGAQRLFTMAVIANVEASFENGWRGREAQGIYLATLNQLGWVLDDTETKLAASWLEQLSVDSQGIIQPTDTPRDVRTEAGQVWVEPELQPADDVPPSASCSSCSRPTTECGELDTYGHCDDCNWQASAVEPAPTAPEQVAREATSGPDFAAMRVRAQVMLDARISALPEDQQAWMTGRTFTGTENPVFEFHRKSIDALVAEIEAINDIELLRTIAAVETHRSDVAGQRDKVILRALIRIRDIEPDPTEPDDADIAHHAANHGNKPMLDDDGDPIFTDTQDEIAANEADHRIVPDKPWPSYTSASEEKLLKTISGAVKPATLEAAIAYELAVDNRPRIIEALRLRLAAITKAA